MSDSGADLNDLILWATVLPLSGAVIIGTLSVFRVLPKVYATYAAAVFTLAFTGMLASMMFLADKKNEQVIADSTAMMMFTGFQAIPIGFLIGDPVTGFAIWLVMVAVASVHGYYFDPGYSPHREGEEMYEDIHRELKNAASKDEYEVPEDPQEVIRNE